MRVKMRREVNLNDLENKPVEISECDWSSDVCSSDLIGGNRPVGQYRKICRLVGLY